MELLPTPLKFPVRTLLLKPKADMRIVRAIGISFVVAVFFELWVLGFDLSHGNGLLWELAGLLGAVLGYLFWVLALPIGVGVVYWLITKRFHTELFVILIYFCLTALTFMMIIGYGYIFYGDHGVELD